MSWEKEISLATNPYQNKSKQGTHMQFLQLGFRGFLDLLF